MRLAIFAKEAIVICYASEFQTGRNCYPMAATSWDDMVVHMHASSTSNATISTSEHLFVAHETLLTVSHAQQEMSEYLLHV